MTEDDIHPPDWSEDKNGAILVRQLMENGPMENSVIDELGMNTKTAMHVAARLVVVRGGDDHEWPVVARITNDKGNIEYHLTTDGEAAVEASPPPELAEMTDPRPLA